MIVELVLKERPSELKIEGYEELDFTIGSVFASPVDKRVEVVVKKHPDGRVSIFTDKSEVIKTITQTAEVVDIHVK